MPPEPPEIRPAAAADLDAINDIYNHYVLHSTCTYQEDPSTAAQRAAWFAAHGARHPVTVAIDGGAIVGWASLSPFHARCAYRLTVENSVYVHPDHHRRGIGRALLRDLLDRAILLGHRQIVAVISADQLPSLALHRALGFRDAGLLRGVGFKFGRWLDVAYLQKSCGTTPSTGESEGAIL
ncbi:MAG TPA: GNAT family N-acetyltransferase [Phycisphaerae bacterium]|nr:GNAT family N-acetyltransferase [Phycisphaerae bacterium]